MNFFESYAYIFNMNIQSWNKYPNEYALCNISRNED